LGPPSDPLKAVREGWRTPLFLTASGSLGIRTSGSLGIRRRRGRRRGQSARRRVLSSSARPLRNRGRRGRRRFGKRPPSRPTLRFFGRFFLRGGVAKAADQNPSGLGIGVLAHKVASARLRDLVASWGALTLASSAAEKRNHFGTLPLPSFQKGSPLPPLTAFPPGASQGLNQGCGAILERFDHWVGRLLAPLRARRLLSPASGGRRELSVDGQGGGRGRSGGLRTSSLRLRPLSLFRLGSLSLGRLVLRPHLPLRGTPRGALHPGGGRGDGRGGDAFLRGGPPRFLGRRWRGGLVALRGRFSLRRWRGKSPLPLLFGGVPKLGHLRLDGLLEDPVTAHEQNGYQHPQQHLAGMQDESAKVGLELLQ